MRTNTRLILCLTVAAGLALTGCVAEPQADSSQPASAPTASVEASVTPSPSPTINVPTEPVPGEVASAVSDRLSTPSSTSSVSGPNVLAADRPFSIEGECIGASADYKLTTADPADAGRLLVEGTIECSAPMKSSFSYTLGYTGVVQLSYTDTDGIERGWLRVVQP